MFEFDVFLSHSSQDKPVVRRLAERLRGDGLRVWLDEWVIEPGDSIPLAVSSGLVNSGVLVLCMSEHFFASDWATFEHHTFLFRDPVNRQRRFVPIRLDDGALPETLQQFLWLDWRIEEDNVYQRLLKSCRPVPNANRDAGAVINRSSNAKIINNNASRGPSDATETIINDGNGNNLTVTQSIDAKHDIDEVKIEESTVNHQYSTVNNQDAKAFYNDMDGSITLSGHTATVTAVAISADGRFIVSASWDDILRVSEMTTGKCVSILIGHVSYVTSAAISIDSRFIVSGSDDNTLRIWDVATSKCVVMLQGHTATVASVAISADGRFIVSGANDKTLRVWNVSTGECTAILQEHNSMVSSVAISADNCFIVSGSWDNTLRIWDVATSKCVVMLQGHTATVASVAISADGRFIVSGANDKTLRVWNVSTGECTAILRGHPRPISSVAISADNSLIVSGSDDHTLRIWDVATNKCVATLEGHTNSVYSVAISAGNRFIVSGSQDKTVRVWDMTALGLVKGDSSAPIIPKYVNARVLLVGDSGVGKSGLALRLTGNPYKETDSTDGAWATIATLPAAPQDADDSHAGSEREVWLWDFAGQNDYRLLHQLFMDAAALAIFVFNPQNDNPFEGLGQWERDIRRAAGDNYIKLLVAGRCDRGGGIVSRQQIDRFVAERGFAEYIETSAKTGDNCDALRDAIRRSIDWSSLPRTVSPRVFRRLKEEIIHLRDTGNVLMRHEELRQQVELALPDETFTPAQFNTVVGLLGSPGILWRLDFGDFILLRPEVLSQYASAVVRTVRAHPDETGCLAEDDLVAGNLDYQDRPRLPRYEEEVILRALLQTLLQRGICFREGSERGNLLIFPSLFRVERPDLSVHPPRFVTYRFAGMLEDVYATLVVRLHHTNVLEKDKLWRNAADFMTLTGQRVGVKVERKYEGNCELTVYCDPAIGIDTRVAFLLYIDGHIRARATEVSRSRHYTCPHCHTPAENHAAIAKLLERGDVDMICIVCRKDFALQDEIEKRFGQPDACYLADDMNRESDIALDNQSKEQILVGEVGAVAGKAGQIFRPTPNADHGIDGEIEFKTATGTATGKRVYLQLKSGDSYLRTRKSDNAEVFDIPDDRHIDYWQAHAYDVWLVIRASNGRVRWMNITAYLKRQTTRSKQVIFDGGDFNAHELVLLRDRLVGTGATPSA